MTAVEVQPNPHVELYGNFQAGYDYLNTHLFDNQLPWCILSFHSRGLSNGIFKKGIWIKDTETHYHEISLNPRLLKRDDDLALQTLARLMVMLKQHTFGTPPDTPDYCNQEFTGMMAAIGLPCEKLFGKGLKHSINPDGRYAHVRAQAMEKFFPLKNFTEWTAPPKTRVRYACPKCGFVAMASGGGNLVCMTEQCNAEMVKEQIEEV